MTIYNATICYSENVQDYPVGFDWNDTLAEVLNEWVTNGVPDTHQNPNINTGGFYSGGIGSGLSGDTYAFSTGDGYAFSVCGDLSYYFPPLSGPSLPTSEAPHNHTLYGTINKISFGGYLDDDGTVIEPFLTICFDEPLEGALVDGHSNLMHDVIWGLMNASIDGYDTSQVTTLGGLVNVLENLYNVDMDQSLFDLGEPFDECDCECPELVGLPEFDDYLLAA